MLIRHHIAPKGPGKSAPRLCEDILLYDPTDTNYNILCDPPPNADGPHFPVKHKHTLTYLPSASKVTYDDPAIVAAICEDCRMHFEIKVDGSNAEPNTCLSSRRNPLHYFIYDEQVSKPADIGEGAHRWEDVRVFACSAFSCPTTVTVTSRPPILRQGLVDLLTDRSVLARRLEMFRQRNNIEADEPLSTEDLPYRALDTLLSYLKNALRRDRRPIPRKNTRYSSLLSDDCTEIFILAHFNETEIEGLSWAPPPASDLDNERSRVRRDLQEMCEEVGMLLDKERPMTQEPLRSLSPAIKKIKHALGCTNYETTTISRNVNRAPHPAYASLGALVDFSDRLIIWCFNRQRECDPENVPYWLHCLSVLADGRISESLQLEVATLRSQGEFTRPEVDQAAKALGIEDLSLAEDELIIGLFRSRLQDAPKQEIQMREHLAILGKYRKSAKILQVAQKVFTDARGAYEWLRIPESTEDAFILSTYQVRIQDNPSEEATANEALKIIAETRQSSALLSFLETGSMYDNQMDLPTAYATLGIEDRSLSDDVIIDVYGLRLADAPSQLPNLRAALRLIGEDRESTKIVEFLKTGRTEMQPDTKGSLDWPFYFTIKPLRDMVLEFDRFQEAEVTEQVVLRKRVGGRRVSRKEIERAKKFMNHLRSLFNALIVSESASVTPEHDLAYLALVSSRDEAERRGSIAMAESAAPDGSDPNTMDIDAPVLDSSPVDDAGSETTLVNESEVPLHHTQLSTLQPADMDDLNTTGLDKENVRPIEEMPADTGEMVVKARAPLRDTEVDTQSTNTNISQDGALTPPPEMPDRPPPPVPPRPSSKGGSADISLMFGRQQDVTECIGNVMFQLEAAIKPKEVDENGEQMDLVKDLFYGKTKQTLAFPGSSGTRTKEELFSHLLVNVAEGDRDIYTALDSSFDIEQVDLEGRQARRYISISHLPPILQIQVQRVQFDREKGSAYKSDAHLNFPETIYMDRYIDTDDPTLQLRRDESWKWKEELRELRKRKQELCNTRVGEDVATVLELAREYLEDADKDIQASPGLHATLEKRAGEIRQELEAIERSCGELSSRIHQQFTDLRKHGYHIHSVFMHRGSVSFGHYWIYIYDFQKQMFRKYNDQYVTEVFDVSEVFTHSGPQPPTPYFLVFVREDQSLQITEALRRVFEGV